MPKTSRDVAIDVQKYHLLSDTEDSQSIDIPSHKPRPWGLAIRKLSMYGFGLLCLSSITMNLVLLIRPVCTVQNGSKWGKYEVGNICTLAKLILR